MIAILSDFISFVSTSFKTEWCQLKNDLQNQMGSQDKPNDTWEFITSYKNLELRSQLFQGKGAVVNTSLEDLRAALDTREKFREKAYLSCCLSGSQSPAFLLGPRT